MNTFERKESKYLLDPMQYLKFRALAAPHLVPAEHHQADIRSIYYDTPDNLLVNRAIANQKYCEKLRVRTYGQAEDTAPAYVEVKRKFKETTSKRRVCCSQAAARAFLEGMDYETAVAHWPLANERAQAESTNAASLQIAGELAWMRDHYHGLSPKLEVLVHRLSFVGADDPDVRITIDADAAWRKAGAGDYTPMFADDERILEVKCPQALPLWLAQALTACEAYPQSISKDVRAYQAQTASARTQALEALRARLASADEALSHRPQHAMPKRRFVAAFKRAAVNATRTNAALQSVAPGSARRPAHANR